MTTTDVRVYADKQATGSAICAELARQVQAALDERDVAHLVLTGGSMGAASLQGLSHPNEGTLDWSRIHLWWGDDRFVPSADAERNELQARQALLDDVPVPDENVHAMPASDGPDGDDLQAATKRYARELSTYAGGERAVPAFDVLLLGMGPDGHIASLFPHHPAQTVLDAPTVAVEDSPKPPPRRISLTYPAISRARQVWFVVAGAEKADATHAALAGGSDRWDIPAADPRGTDATIWWLDEAAASHLGSR